MNRAIWQRERKLSILALKLCEEAAEVGTEISDALVHTGVLREDRLREELSHVEFIAAEIRSRLDKGEFRI